MPLGATSPTRCWRPLRSRWPSGRGARPFLWWLWPTMRPVLGSKTEAARFARWLLVDGFRDQVLVPSRDEFRGLFTFADFSSLEESLGRDFWFDEIHPTEAGFATLSLGFNAMIQAALPTPKQAAVFV